MNWVTVHVSELSREEKPRTGGHSFAAISKHVTWPRFCSYCGHIPLKNDVSVLVTKIGCGYERDPRYQSWRRNVGGTRG